MAARKSEPERKSRSGSYVPDDKRGTVRVVIRCSPELAKRAREAAKGSTLADVLEAVIVARQRQGDPSEPR